MATYGKPEQYYSLRSMGEKKFRTWQVEEIDSRKRRKAGTLAIGNSSIVWSCEANKVYLTSPLQPNPYIRGS